MTFAKQTTVYFAAAAIAIVAWILNASFLYWMAGALWLLPQATRLFGLLEHRGVELARELPHAAHQGEAVTVRLRARNLTSLPKLQLSLRDDLPPGLTPLDPEPVPVHLPPSGTDRGEYILQLRRRGVFTLKNVLVQSTDLLGLHDLRTQVPVAGEILVYPRVVELPPDMVPPTRGGGQAPLETARRQGEGSSFFGIREYRPGDPLRHVHWRTTARRGRLVVVEWEAEESTDAVIALETREGSELPLENGATLDLAASLGASLAAYVLAAGDSLRVVAPGTADWRAMADRGTPAMSSILETLARVRAAATQGLAAELRQAAPRLAPGALVCWLTPLPDEALLATARFLQAAGLRPVIYALEAPETAARWAQVAAELESFQVPVRRLRPDDALTRLMLS